ncbi:MAG: hypothetical protein AAFO88_05190 [Pseudomonadota bacterium]
MTFAKYTVFELIRAIRRLGAVGLFIMGLLVGSTLIAAFTDHSDQTRSGRFTADAAVAHTLGQVPLPSQPWSRVMGADPFEKITDVALTNTNAIVFAGLSLGVEHNQSSHAVIVRTGPHGFVDSQVRVNDPSIGSVSRAVLDDEGAARLVHWIGSSPAFARTDGEGEVIWSRAFNVGSDQAWADIKDARNGHSLVALSNGLDGGDLRVMRLDERGKVLWRGDLAPVGPVETVHLFDSGDGGALIAIETMADGDARTIALARLDRRGRQAWHRELLRGVDARLADAALDSEGSVVLLAGAPSALIRFDGLGQLSWMRDLPHLAMSGRHLIAPMRDGGVQVMAEPATTNAGRRHWVARFDPDGREVWSRTRANRSNATLEAAQIAPNGLIIAGGSMVGSASGDTDMLMMAVASDGTFPQGFGSTPSLDLEPGEAEPPAPASTVMAASLVVDGSRALQAAYAADTAALQAAAEASGLRTPEPTVRDPLQLTPALETLAVASGPAPGALPEMREVSAPVELSALSASSIESTASASPQPGAQDIETVAASPRQAATSAAAIADAVLGNKEEPRAEAASFAWSPQAERPAYAYQCTFTCLADSDDVVKYPVTRIIANVTEENANLVSLDIMAMDNGICLATGGSVFDDPRLPPVCERVN